MPGLRARGAGAGTESAPSQWDRDASSTIGSIVLANLLTHALHSVLASLWPQEKLRAVVRSLLGRRNDGGIVHAKQVFGRVRPVDRSGLTRHGPGYAQEPGERYALLVGVRKYAKTSELRKLHYTERNMEELAGVLRAGATVPRTSCS